ncbi:hypothetical protein CCP3SC1_30039 [Gammaproteobacteria bacterium]
MSASPSAPTVRERLYEIRLVCELGPLTDGDLDHHWIDTVAGRVTPEKTYGTPDPTHLFGDL